MKSIKRVTSFLGLMALATATLVGCNKSSDELTQIKVAEVTHSVFMHHTTLPLVKDS